jgi:hypothetical protein
VANVVADLHKAALELEGIESNDPEYNALIREARGALTEAATRLERLAAIPGSPELAGWLAEHFVRGFFLDVGGIFGRIGEVEGNRQAAETELRFLIATYKRLEVARLGLPGLAARYAGPRATGARTISIDLDAAWGPVGPDDRLTLFNRTGADLHNCTVLVELRAAGGEASPSVYFVPRWPAGTPIYARCPAGTAFFGEAVGSRTVPRVASILASFWSDELTRESIRYAYEGTERDADLARYCADMRVAASYRPFARGLLWNTERGVIVRLEGLRHAPRPRILVSFRRAGGEISCSWDFDRWDEGESKTLDTAGKLPWDPESYRVEVGFPDTSDTFRWAERPR